jgi:hypothetical protein
MTNSVDRTSKDSVEQGAQGAASVPVVETVVRTRDVEAGHATNHSAPRTKKGRAAVVAVVLGPVLLGVLIVLAYWAFAAFKSNSEAAGPDRIGNGARDPIRFRTNEALGIHRHATSPALLKSDQVAYERGVIHSATNLNATPHERSAEVRGQGNRI